MKINGYAATSKGSELSKYSYDKDSILPSEVSIKITHCGICHSDVHLIDNDWHMSNYPFIPGHEIVGVVDETGKDVKHLKKGDRVGVGWQSNCCKECKYCKSDREELCSKSEGVCVGRNGGYADHVVVDSQFAVKIPENLSSEKTAPLLCGGITVFNPISKYVKAGSRVGVIGIGGLGHMAIMFASAMGANVTAFSRTADKEDEVKSLGAKKLVVTKNQEDLKKLQGQFDFIISTVSASIDWSPYVAMLDKQGVLCFVGASSNTITIPVMDIFTNEKVITGSVIGSIRAISEMLKFASKHNIGAKVEVLDMKEANKGLKKVRDGDAHFRVVLKN